MVLGVIFNCQVSMDQHALAYEYLDRHGLNGWAHDLDDIICMVEQVVAGE